MQTNNQYYKLICENMGIPIEEGIHTNNYYLRRIAQSYGISYTEKTICNGMILKDIAEAITENTYTGHHFNNFYLKDIAESLTGNDYNTEFDNYYLEVWAENTIAKNTTNLSWDIEITDFVYSDEFNASGILTSNGNPISNAPVNLMIGNTVMATATTNANGIVSFTNAPVHVGTHRFYLKFNGNANYIESSSTIVEINVSKETSQMVITNEDNDNYYTDAPIAIVGSLVDNDTPTHQPISTKTITVTDGIHNYTGETESDGSFLIPISNLPIGTYTFDIEFSDEDYTTSSKQLVMNIVDPYLSVSATKDILSYEDGDSSVLTATLHSGSAVGKSIKIYKDDVLLETKQTDSSGQVSVTYESAGVGDVVFKFEYGILVIQTYTIHDYWKYEPNTYTSQQVKNITLPPTDWEIKYTLKRTSTYNAVSYLNLRNNSHQVLIGCYGSSGENGILVRDIGGTTNLDSSTIPTNIPTTEYEVTIKFENNVITWSWGTYSASLNIASYIPTILYSYEVQSNNKVQNLSIKPL